MKYGDGDMQIQPATPAPTPTPDPNARCNPNKPLFPVENGHWIWDDQWVILCDSERGIGTVQFRSFYCGFVVILKLGCGRNRTSKFLTDVFVKYLTS